MTQVSNEVQRRKRERGGKRTQGERRETKGWGSIDNVGRSGGNRGRQVTEQREGRFTSSRSQTFIFTPFLWAAMCTIDSASKESTKHTPRSEGESGVE